MFAAAGIAQQSVSSSSQLNSDSIPNDWSFEADAYYYLMPNDKNTTTLIGTADHKALHIEARYNYEDQKTFSLFGGYNFETGKELVLDLTPMLGFAVGNINGLIPGLELNLTWGIIDYYSESEYVFDFEEKENNYFYTWAELGITPFDNLRAGAVTTRTLLYKSDPEFEYGALVQYSFWKMKAMIYYFNPFNKNDSYLIPTIGVEF
ncbi:MAG: hypothetical protein IPL53_22560 [Ignavibacteria bacterium]|nr:hypothetical protein [Ignavibacteria bacterium]